MKNLFKSEKGSVMIELVFTCLILVVLMLCAVEVINIVRADIYIHKIAREGAREAAITNSLENGNKMAEDCARQYFTSSKPSINSYVSKNKNVVYDVFYSYRHFSFLNKTGYGGVDLNARAIYPWWDQNT